MCYSSVIIVKNLFEWRNIGFHIRRTETLFFFFRKGGLFFKLFFFLLGRGEGIFLIVSGE